MNGKLPMDYLMDIMVENSTVFQDEMVRLMVLEMDEARRVAMAQEILDGLNLTALEAVRDHLNECLECLRDKKRPEAKAPGRRFTPSIPHAELFRVSGRASADIKFHGFVYVNPLDEIQDAIAEAVLADEVEWYATEVDYIDLDTEEIINEEPL